MKNRYSADITAGALKVPESRIIAGLLLDGWWPGWKDAIVKENVLQARSPATATRLATPDPRAAGDDGAGPVEAGPGRQGHASPPMPSSPPPSSTARCSATSSIWSSGSSTGCSARRCRTAIWDDYLDGCRGRDPDMPQWNESTRRRLRSSVFQMLAQAGYIENTRSLKLQTVHVAGQVLRYLKAHDEEYVLRCIQVAP